MILRKGLVGHSTGKFELRCSLQTPPPGPSMIVCKVTAVALNPADAKISDFSSAEGSLAGFDFSGQVVQVGDEVTKLKPGDRVFGITCGHNTNDKSAGAFADYVLAMADLTCKIPDSMSFEEACTYGLGIGTAGCALYSYLGFQLPDSFDSQPVQQTQYVLVSGGATASGVFLIQLLKLSGLIPIATCSPRSAPMVISLGAVETFDYHSSDCGIRINNFTQGSLAFAVDCVSTADTMSMCYQAIGDAGGKYLALDPISTHVQYTRRDIYADWIVAITIFGCPVRLPGVYGRPCMPEHRELAGKLYSIAERLLLDGKLKGPRYQICAGGLEKINEGIDNVRKGRANEGKLVYSLAL